ncbi:uncharacterized protein LOC124476474 isoform X2 [Hypomesus transpacificus]|uniref:uncharacterized protein LOC124476474 isoform X2 n=1 Tax=Hypomesus transpacificus TaxID=137520 RepID=UPI001F08535C|nr:uncharacterized protein LOC124476474 isoform X2 [Hypomesus transpacificus]
MGRDTMKPLGKRHCCMSFVCFFLLLLLAQMLYVLVLLHGLFINSTKALISPFNVCHRGQDGLFCNDHNYDVGDASKLNTNIARVTVILGLYSPLALVPFALLAFLFAVCCEEGGLLWVSLVCQTASSLLTLLGLCVYDPSLGLCKHGQLDSWVLRLCWGVCGASHSCLVDVDVREEEGDD